MPSKNGGAFLSAAVSVARAPWQAARSPGGRSPRGCDSPPSPASAPPCRRGRACRAPSAAGGIGRLLPRAPSGRRRRDCAASPPSRAAPVSLRGIAQDELAVLGIAARLVAFQAVLGRHLGPDLVDEEVVHRRRAGRARVGFRISVAILGIAQAHPGECNNDGTVPQNHDSEGDERSPRLLSRSALPGSAAAEMRLAHPSCKKPAPCPFSPSHDSQRILHPRSRHGFHRRRRSNPSGQRQGRLFLRRLPDLHLQGLPRARQRWKRSPPPAARRSSSSPARSFPTPMIPRPSSTTTRPRSSALP